MLNKNISIKNYNENGVNEMKKSENVVNLIENNNEGVNVTMNNIDMEKIKKFVLNAIKDSEEKSIRFSDKSMGARQLQSALYYDTEDTMTYEEQEYCKSVLYYMELSNSTDFIKALYSAEGTDIFEVTAKSDSLFNYPENAMLRKANYVKDCLEREIKRDYAIYKLPFIKETLNSFMEWYKTEIEYDYVLYAVMENFEDDGVADIHRIILSDIENALEGTTISEFTDYEEESIFGVIWDNFKSLIDSEYLENEYEETLSDFKEEFIGTYK